jgi:hypothetical protein
MRKFKPNNNRLEKKKYVKANKTMERLKNQLKPNANEIFFRKNQINTP